jgi:methionyl-tRNA formyltransferase
MRIVYMGTPDFAVPALVRLIEARHDIACVYTQPPRPAGRGGREQMSPVHQEALRRGLTVRHPASLKSESAQQEFAALNADVAVVAAYGLILPKPVLAAPRLGCINIHASLLPRWRGAAPIQHAILAGDTETGVTIMQMDEGLDTGPMILQEKIPIGPATTGQSLHDALAELGAQLIVPALDRVAAGAKPPPQPDGATYAPKLTREDGRLDWRRPAAMLERQVRAFDPWPGAWFEHRGERFKVLRAYVAPGHAGAAPGTVLADLTVACGEGALNIASIQRAGKAAMSAADFLRGYSIAPGTVL